MFLHRVAIIWDFFLNKMYEYATKEVINSMN